MQTVAIICSEKDPAGLNIRTNLIDNFKFEKNDAFEERNLFELKQNNQIIRLYLIQTELVHSENLDEKIDADIFIFASKHRSKENTPSFAVHSIGNFGAANLGGKEKTLVNTSSSLIKNIFIEINNLGRETDFEITMEATHHGPFLNKPSAFVEIGSTENEWNDPKNGKIIAKAIINSITNGKNYRAAIGIGGPHYCNSFNKIAQRTDIAFSFICPKFNLQNLDDNLIDQMISKTIERIDFAVLDWKGLGQEKQKIVEILMSKNIQMLRSDKL